MFYSKFEVFKGQNGSFGITSIDQIRLNNKNSVFPKNRSPLRYPGGKSRAINIICSFIPAETKEICSPFFGGGSIEIACADMGIKVHGYDIFSPLVDFWQCLLEDSSRLSNIVKNYFPLSWDRFYELQKIQGKVDDIWERAAIFYVLNRSSYSGATLSGGMSPGHERFTISSIQRLRDFKTDNISIKKNDFTESILQHKNTLLYLDPPYLIESKIYGEKGSTHRGFDHPALNVLLKKRDKWILSYNNCPEILEAYMDYTVLFPNWKYGMSNDKNSKEVLILSHDIAEIFRIRGL